MNESKNDPVAYPAPGSADELLTELSGKSTSPIRREGEFVPGSILWINQRVVALYKMAVPEKGYHILLVPSPGGTIKTRFIDIGKYTIEELGVIEDHWFNIFQEKMLWNRDVIVFHCYSMIDALKVAIPACETCPNLNDKSRVQAIDARATASIPRPAEPPRPIQDLRRGQRIQITMGHKAWNAVFWGKDDEGYVVAHHTVGDWSLMHLNLDQYASTLRVLSDPDPALVGAIESALPRD